MFGTGSVTFFPGNERLQCDTETNTRYRKFEINFIESTAVCKKVRLNNKRSLEKTVET